MRAGIALTAVAIIATASLIRVLLAAPDYGRPPRLASVVDGGKMEEFLETPSQKDAIVSWVAAGAPERGWPEVEQVLEGRCTTCHYSDASFEMLPLDNYGDAHRAAQVLPVLREKVTGGTMGEYLETAQAQATLVAWIDGGAKESDWPSAKSVLDAHCIHCHNPEGVQGIVRLQTYASVSRLASLPLAAPKPVAAPSAVLAASLGGLAVYWRRRKSSGA